LFPLVQEEDPCGHQLGLALVQARALELALAELALGIALVLAELALAELALGIALVLVELLSFLDKLLFV
jgi:hypothetical protein